jgi:protein-S-isoprenylcysteine O-methyltransferase Ste14
MMAGLMLAFWATPDLTVGRLIFASGMSLYILIGIRFEERDMENRLGQPYREYRRRTPALIPRPHFGNAVTEVTSPDTYPADGASRR